MKEGRNKIIINEIEYSYLISKSEDNDSLTIKLYESIPKTNIYFLYQAQKSKLKKDIAVLSLYDDNIEAMITSLNEVFSQGNAKFEEMSGKYFLKLKFGEIDILKKSVIELIKCEPVDPIIDLKNRIKVLETNYNILLEKNKNKNDDIKGIIREVLQEKDIKKNLFLEMEQMLLSKYNLITNENGKNSENRIEKIIENEIKKKEKILNEKIKQEEKQIIANINEIKNIKQQLIDNEAKKGDILHNNNFILLKIYINSEDVNKKIHLINQDPTYKYFCNFERDDIEILIDGVYTGDVEYERDKPKLKIAIEQRNYDLNDKIDNLKYNLNKKIDYLEHDLREMFDNLTEQFYYYLTFKNKGIYTIKIIFKKKLSSCRNLFKDCNQISEIDCSNFDCSQVINCSGMFRNCSKLKKLNLGHLDFCLSKKFAQMFENCKNLEELDVSFFNTKNSYTFCSMFNGCSKLKEINVSNFESSKCLCISKMFSGCESITSIDMLNWNMKSIEIIKEKEGLSNSFDFSIWDCVVEEEAIGIDLLFNGCINLRSIKMSSNFSDLNKWRKKNKNLFFGNLPNFGTFIWKKGVNCDELLSLLPVSWNRLQE